MNSSNVNEILDGIVRRMVEAAHPEKIILFGSAARGESGLDSDVDLLVVMNTQERPQRRSYPLSQLFRPRPCPLDIIVYTPQEAERFSREPESFYASVLSEGRILYDRAA